ncbi:UNVERIFIED_CONTAM: hypothetical protein HHA_209070 [Hammondia hammondi]|eukprot:XP_008887031.1 hypothetical protein HHA_209070 [Hammondia hammondi]
MWTPKRPSFWEAEEERGSSLSSSAAASPASASASAASLSSLQSRERSREGKRATQQTEGGETEEGEKGGAGRGPGGFESDEDRKETATAAAATRDNREEERRVAASRFSGEKEKTGRNRRDAERGREEKDGAAPVFSVSFLSEEVSRKREFSEESANPRCSAGAPRVGGDDDDEKAKREEEALAALSPLGQEIFFAVRGIRDPEFPVYTLGDLGVTTPEMICMQNEEALRTGDREAEQGERDGTASEEAGAGCGEARSVLRGTKEAASVHVSSSKRENSLSDEFRRQPPTQTPHSSSSSSGHVSCSSSSSRVSGSFSSSPAVVKVGLVPTNAKCSMVSLIGLAVRCKLSERFPFVSPNFFLLQQLHHEAEKAHRETEKEEEEEDEEEEEEEEEEVETNGRRSKRQPRRQEINNGDVACEESERSDAGSASNGHQFARVCSSLGQRKRMQKQLFVDLEIFAHEDARGLTKQLNDKERVCAALENPQIRELVLAAIKED